MSMKCICKQCGKPFELSDSEIAFYQSKNLNLPKRCKACRAANKKEKAKGTEKERPVQSRGTDSFGGQNNKGSKWVYALIAVVTLLVIGMMGLSNPEFPPGRSAPVASVVEETAGRVAAENKASIGEAENKSAIGEAEESGNRNAAEAPPEHADDETETRQNAPEAGSMEQGGSEAGSANQNESEAGSVQKSETGAEAPPDADTVVSSGADGADVREYAFRNDKLLQEHFEKHGKEMEFSSAEEYQAAASAVVNHGDALHKTEKEDGDDVYYLETTNEFVIVSTDGYIRTYFKPDSGMDYFNRQ